VYSIPKYIGQKITRIRKVCDDNSHVNLNLLSGPAIINMSDTSDKDDKCGSIKRIKWGSRYDDVKTHTYDVNK